MILITAYLYGRKMGDFWAFKSPFLVHGATALLRVPELDYFWNISGR